MKKVLFAMLILALAVATGYAIAIAASMPSKPLNFDVDNVGQKTFIHAKHAPKGCPKCHDGQMGKADFKPKETFSAAKKFTGCTTTAGCHDANKLKTLGTDAPAAAPKQ